MVSHLLDSDRDDPTDHDDVGGREDLIVVGVFRRLVHRLDARSWELLLAPILTDGDVAVQVLKAGLGAGAPYLSDDTLVRLLAAGRVMDALMLAGRHTSVWLARCGSPVVLAPAGMVGDGWADCFDCFVSSALTNHPNGPLARHVSHV
jgi:hypothetical protein